MTWIVARCPRNEDILIQKPGVAGFVIPVHVMEFDDRARLPYHICDYLNGNLNGATYFEDTLVSLRLQLKEANLKLQESRHKLYAERAARLSARRQLLDVVNKLDGIVPTA